MATITIGPPVLGDDFYDREPLINELWSVIEKGSAILAAPRRVGKTSIMLHVRDNPRSDYANRVFYLEGEYYSSPEELVADLIVKASKALPTMKRLLKTLLAGVSNIDELEVWELNIKLREKLRGNWKNDGAEIIRELVEEGKPCLLIIDELSILLNKITKMEGGPNQALELLHWLRGLRQEFAGRVSMIMASSLGIGRVASLLNASRTLNDLRQVEVGPFDNSTARQFAGELLKSKNLEINTETMDALLKQVGTYIPIFIQMMVAALASEVRSRSIKSSPELVKWCYEERVHGPEFRQQFEDYYERFNRYYTPDEARTAKRLLKELAFSEEGVSYAQLYQSYIQELRRKASPEAFDRLLTALQEDFYITYFGSDKKVQFHNKWLRDWWRRFHALGS